VPTPVNTLAEAFVLISWWKAILLLLPFVPWAYLVSSVFDKHAGRFYLGQERWAAVHTAAGIAAFALAFFMPIPAWWGFIVSMIAVLAILGGDIALFVMVTNRHENVPDHAKLKIDLSKLKASREAKAAARQAATVTLALKTPSGKTVPPPQKDTPEYEVRTAAEKLFIDAKINNANRVEVLPTGKENVYGVRSLIDGVWTAGEQMPANQAIKLIDLWKEAAGLDVSDRRRRLIGRTQVMRDDVKTPVRVTASGVRGGMKLTLTLDPEGAVQRSFEDLGPLESQLEAFRNLPTGGIVLLGAKPLQGATTTLYAAVQTHDAYTQNVQTMEMEPEAALEGVKQVQYEASADGPEYSTMLRSIIRRDPDVVGVAEIPDAETAREIAHAEADRVRLYASVRADSALGAVQFFAKAVGSPSDAARGLRAAMAQKLLRKLCENCRVPYEPPQDMVKKLGLPPDKVKQLYKKGGQVLVRNKPETCPVCGGRGYDGQIGAFEIYSIGDDERALIGEQDWSGLRAAWRKQQLPSIQQVALRRAVEGLTSIEEITRVTAPPKQQQKPKSAEKPAQAAS